MKQYYLYNGSAPEGPFQLEELKRMGVGPDSLIWTEGMESWTKAKDLPEFRPLLKMRPLPPAGMDGSNASAAPDTRLGYARSSNLSLIISVLTALGLIIFFFIRLSRPSEEQKAAAMMEDPVTPDTAVILPQSAIEPPSLSPEEQKRAAERKSPGRYLVIHTASEKNLLMQPVIKGSVFNNASATTYTGIRLRVAYSDENGNLIGEEYIEIENPLQPKGLAEIRHKPSKRTYRKADRYDVTVSAAQAAR